MTSETDIEDKLRDLAAALAKHQAELIGLATIVTQLPGASKVDRARVDAAIEAQCRELDRGDRDAACNFADGMLQTARENAQPGTFGAQEGHMRDYQRGS